jgi:hypothetical protein
MPDIWMIIATYPLCGEKSRYLPSEILWGKLSHKFEPGLPGSTDVSMLI